MLHPDLKLDVVHPGGPQAFEDMADRLGLAFGRVAEDRAQHRDQPSGDRRIIGKEVPKPFTKKMKDAFSLRPK